MKKIDRVLLSLTCLLIYSSVFGQQVYRVNHYGKPGDVYLYNRFVGAQHPEILVSGPNVTWNVSADANLNTHPSQIVTPSEGIDQFTFATICTLSGHSFFDCLSIWSNTEQALLIPDTLSLITFTLTNLQRYQNVTTNQLLENFFGFTADLGGSVTQAVIVYQSPDTTINFPVEYGKQWTSRIKWAIDLAAAGQNIAYSSKQSRSTSIDSWGTLITPFDTFQNVVRLRSEIVREDTLYTDSLIVPISLTQVEYMWFDTNYTLPVMTANGLATDSADIINAFQYIYEATCPIPTWVVDTDQDTYYVVTGATLVNFVITNSNANEYSWDFGDGTFGTSTGNISHLYSTPGIYSVGVSGCMTNCLPLNSCSSDIIDFEIIHTLSALPLISGEDLGIKVYPNPVQASFTVEIPDDLGEQRYQIFDISGREVDHGILKTGKSFINSDKLVNGLYIMNMQRNEGIKDHLAVIRLCVLK